MSKMKRIRSFSALFLAILVSLALFLPVSAQKDPIYDLSLDSQGVYVFNPQTDTAIYEKAENSRMFPASTTKIMTALVTLEMCDDPKNTVVTVPNTDMFYYIIADGGVHMRLSKGEEFTVYDLLMALMISSYCDVGDLLAYHLCDGDISAFVNKMNEKAQSLNLENTHFENTHGLHSPDHYSSPRDMAYILWEAVQNPAFREILETKTYTVPATSVTGERILKHTVNIYKEENAHYLDAFVGGKSGFTNQAGRCLATYSEKDGLSFVSVLFGSNMDTTRSYAEYMAYTETSTLVAYAYENFELATVLEEGTVLGNVGVIDSETKIPVVAGSDITLLKRKDSEPEFKKEFPDHILATDLKKDGKVGEIKLLFNGEEAEGSYPILLSWDGVPVVTKSALQKGAESTLNAVTGIFRDKAFLTLIILLLVLIALCIPAMRITRLLHRRKSHKPKH